MAGRPRGQESRPGRSKKGPMLPSLPTPWRRVLRAACLALALAATPRAQTPNPPPPPIPIGMNLRPLTPFDRAWVFADAMKLASEWRYEDTGKVPSVRSTRGGKVAPRETVPLDANGWPRPVRGCGVACDVFLRMRGRLPAAAAVSHWEAESVVVVARPAE